MEGADDPYEVLGVSHDANAQEIRSAFRKAALRHHPDKQRTDEERQRATVMFAKISNAYEILSDENERRQYDRQQQQQNYGNFDDFFHHHRFHDPFQVFNSVFREEFGAPSTSFPQSGFRDPFQDFMGGSMMMDPFGSRRRGGGDFGGGFFGGTSDPFADMFSSMRQMQDQMTQDMDTTRQGQNANNTSQSFVYSSSIGGNGQESVTTQTTSRMVNGRQQILKERIIRRADGTVEREVLEQSGDDDFPEAIEDAAAAAAAQPHRRFLPFGNRRNSSGEQPPLQSHDSDKQSKQRKTPRN